MKFKILFTTSLALLALASCSQNSTSPSGGAVNVGTGAFDFEASATYPIKINTANSYYVQGSPNCDSTLVDTMWWDTVNYQVTNGKLLTWGQYAGSANPYTGSSSQLLGTWTQGNISVAIPNNTNAFTPDTLPSGEVGSVVFTSNTMTVKQSDKSFCWADIRAKNYVNTPSANFTKINCNSFSITSAGQTATFTLVALNGSTGAFTETFNYNGKTCSLSNTGNDVPTASLCANAWANYQAGNPTASDNYYWYEHTANGLKELAYQACRDSTGFKDLNN